MTSRHGEGVGEQVQLSIMLLATLAKSVGICNGMPSTVHISFCHHFPLPLIQEGQSSVTDNSMCTKFKFWLNTWRMKPA